jgi:hypothetical protein
MAAFAAVLIAGCGGASGVKPAVYVKSLCAALGTWKSTIQTAGLQLESSGAASAARPVAKRDYQRFVAVLVSATQHAASALQSAGTPAVTNGTQIASGLNRAFVAASRRLAQANAQAQTIPTTSASSFQLGASAVTSEIRTALSGIAGVTPRKSPGLRAAAAKEPACQVLRG